MDCESGNYVRDIFNALEKIFNGLIGIQFLLGSFSWKNLGPVYSLNSMSIAKGKLSLGVYKMSLIIPLAPFTKPLAVHRLFV